MTIWVSAMIALRKRGRGRARKEEKMHVGRGKDGKQVAAAVL